MSGKLLKELRQTKPFPSPEHEAFLNVVKTAAVLEQAQAALLKPFGLSPTQYNVLRILRGAGAEGLACQAIGERMIAKDPDITRLMDRLEARTLVARARSREDRRVVVTRITEAGLQLLAEIDPLERDAPRKVLGHLGRKRLEQLIDLLEEARERP